MRAHPVVLAMLATAVVAGCGSPAPSATATPGGTAAAVRIVTIPSYAPLVCPDARVPAFRLRIDPWVRPGVWGEYVFDDRRIDVIWPPGFRLELTSGEPALIDQDGRVFGEDGDVITDAGGSLGDPVFICQRGSTYYRLT